MNQIFCFCSVSLNSIYLVFVKSLHLSSSFRGQILFYGLRIFHHTTFFWLSCLVFYLEVVDGSLIILSERIEEPKPILAVLGNLVNVVSFNIMNSPKKHLALGSSWCGFV